jgi:starch-binding outer membrane protein, SusD/RagB family
MKTKRIIIFVFIIALLGSCGKFLEPYPNGNYDSETLWQYQNLVQGLIGYCYDQVNSNNRHYADNEGVYLDGATDDAVVTSSTNVMRRYAVNSMTTSQDPFATYWDRDYRAIRNCNLFLKDRRGYNTKYIRTQAAPSLDTWNNLVRNRLQGEAFALRAYFEWDLLQRFGGMANGVMLGFPIVTNVLNATDNINLARNPYDDCVRQIIADCDSAYKYLPIAHRDYLAVAADLAYSGGKYWGRFDGITMRAIKANVYLTWASPRFNPANIIARWDSAAVNAKKVIDFKMVRDVLSPVGNSFTPAAGVAWTNPNSPEIVFSTRYNGSNTTMERLFYPGGFAGTASVGATQELVDAFPMANGYPITDLVNSGYNPANPYAGRDPRFYSTIFYNNAKANRNNDITKPMYTFENWNEPVPGKDAANTKSDNTRTNYYIKKYVFMGWNNSDVPVSSTNHSKFIYRWAHMLLIYAEAANKVVGPLDAVRYNYAGTPNPMSARTAIQYLRARKTYDGANGLSVAPPAVPTLAQDGYLINTAAAGPDAFDALVRNERRIETCFEGLRFYDLRRWTTDANWASVINAPVHGAYIAQVAPGVFNYNLNYVVEQRNFPSPYNPIPYTEILRMTNLQQNDGWANWN